MRNILFSLWFFLPAGLANASPIFAVHIPIIKNWSRPIDFGLTIRGRQIFGPHKTWRGLAAGLLTGIVVVALQRVLYDAGGFFQTISEHVYYPDINPLVLGSLLGLGALLGDAIESFFKRQLRIPSGHTWIPFDQIDYIVGGLLASSLVIRLQASQYIWILVTWVALHFLSTFIGYKLGLKDKPV